MERQERKKMRQEREELRRRVDQAGGPADLKETLVAGISRLTHQNNFCEERKAALRLVFSQTLEKWWTTAVPPHQIPFPIPEDRQTARRYLGAAYACVAFEALLSASTLVTFLNLSWGIAILVGTVVAVLAATIFESSLSLLFRQGDRPKQTLNDIRRRVLWPSFLLFAISLLFWLAARTATGEMAIILEPALQVALWLTTVSLVLLGASLLAAAFLVRWSKNISDGYRAIEQEQIAGRVLRETFMNRLKAHDLHVPRLLLPAHSAMSQE